MVSNGWEELMKEDMKSDMEIDARREAWNLVQEPPEADKRRCMLPEWIAVLSQSFSHITVWDCGLGFGVFTTLEEEGPVYLLLVPDVHSLSLCKFTWRVWGRLHRIEWLALSIIK